MKGRNKHWKKKKYDEGALDGGGDLDTKILGLWYHVKLQKTTFLLIFRRIT